ncbi:hypothetical protein [Chondromyces apiculatus]|uniref:Uncharacterized protein n=1 Tax=Chondromyces apiculatus DSM 436 TaxID=1192034 RepID=A0A017T787_9BACT|nr:hypothetical protein [Chondromyces apiculatus]EYF04456.1 Hypothetical protein CAP_4424 [Chondromyces apiculatus DSM 436]
MSTLSTLGIVHTAISLAAIPTGIASFARHGRIAPETRVGKVYLAATLLGALTAFGVLKTPVGLGIILMTLLALAAGISASYLPWSALARRYVETISLSVSFFFVLLPGVTETLTRLPVGAPIAPSLNAPILLAAQSSLVLALAAGLALQISRLRAAPRLRAVPRLA